MKKNIFFSILAAASLFVACNDGDSGVTRLEMRLTDAPAAYDAVMIEIKEIHVKTSGSDVEIQVNQKINNVINLLDLANGVDTLIADQDIPSGKLSQIRLVLGENNYVVVDGVEHQLTVPSGQQSGLKLNVHADLVPDVAYKMWLDFDASRSIVVNNNKYILKPVIRTFTEATSAVIKGSVIPADSKAYVMAVSQDLADTTTAYADETTGLFLMRAMQNSEYTISFEAEGFPTKTTQQVVELGKTYDMGVVNMDATPW